MKQLAHRVNELERTQDLRPAPDDVLRRLHEKLTVLARNLGDVEPKPDPPTPEQIAGIRAMVLQGVEDMRACNQRAR